MSTPSGPGFRLRFQLNEVPHWADRYSYMADATVELIGEAVRARGWYTRDEFLAVSRWKSPRSRSRAERNDASSVEEATGLALSTPGERLRIEALVRLNGVQYPTASVLLHLAHRDPYPIIDFRALWALGVEAPRFYTFAFWAAYVDVCRSLALRAAVPMRTLDRALWQYSKEHQPPRATAPGPQPRSRKEAPRASIAESRNAVKGAPVARQKKYPYRADIHARLIETAARGDTIAYSAVGTGRAWVGAYLYRIAKEEQAAGRPPLTALVVHKADGRPGPGFLEAAKWVDFWRPGETEDEVWQRAIAAVHEYWRPKLSEDLR